MKNYYEEAAKLSQLINDNLTKAIEFIRADPVVLRCRGCAAITCSGSYEIVMWLYPGMMIKEDSSLMSNSNFKDFCHFVIETMAAMMPEESEFVAYGYMKYAFLTGWKDFADVAMKISPLHPEAKASLKEEFGDCKFPHEWGTEYVDYIFLP
jgi:hypothetical protein